MTADLAAIPAADPPGTAAADLDEATTTLAGRLDTLVRPWLVPDRTTGPGADAASVLAPHRTPTATVAPVAPVVPPEPAAPRLRLLPAVRPVAPAAPRATREAVVPGVPPTAPERVRALRVRDAEFEGEVLEVHDDEAPTQDPARAAASVAQAVVEVLAGSRPVAQLARWLAPTVYEEVRVRAGLQLRAATARSRRAATVRRVRAVRVSERSAEAAVVVAEGDRVRAAALRLDAHRGQWRVTALELA